MVAGDLLDEFAKQEAAKDAALVARKEAFKRAQEESGRPPATFQSALEGELISCCFTIDPAIASAGRFLADHYPGGLEFW